AGPAATEHRVKRGEELAIGLMARYEMVPMGPFDLETQTAHFGGWPRRGDAIVMAFPVEGWKSSAAVVLRQLGAEIRGEIHGATGAEADRAWRQALATVSLDVDGRGFEEVGRRDPVIGWLQPEYQNLARDRRVLRLG